MAEEAQMLLNFENNIWNLVKFAKWVPILISMARRVWYSGITNNLVIAHRWYS